VTRGRRTRIWRFGKRIEIKKKVTFLERARLNGVLTRENESFLRTTALEDLILLKLETAAEISDYRPAGFGFYRMVRYAIIDALYRYARVAVDTAKEASDLLGVRKNSLLRLFEASGVKKETISKNEKYLRNRHQRIFDEHKLYRDVF